MLLIRRFVVLSVLAFWQGGFAFYAVVVVPVGQAVLGSHIQQGFITRQVTNYLNAAGFVAAVLMIWEMAAATRTQQQTAMNELRAATRLRILAWFGMLLTLLFQVWLHGRLELLLDARYLEIRDESRFYAEHRWYLLSSAAQWLCCLAFTGATLRIWRTSDRCESPPTLETV